MTHYSIDFFELAFLAEACIPPVPIARSMFWDKLINVHHAKMTPDERVRLFEWITDKRSDRFDISNESCSWFWYRFNPAFQYTVTAMGKEHHAFLFDGQYYVARNQYIVRSEITDIKKTYL